jgi:hypothetical protein
MPTVPSVILSFTRYNHIFISFAAYGVLGLQQQSQPVHLPPSITGHVLAQALGILDVYLVLACKFILFDCHNPSGTFLLRETERFTVSTASIQSPKAARPTASIRTSLETNPLPLIIIP